jgi:BirA family biotin operon repressor/biotin-[acetyl-CoA-carboxylase] ligase
MKATDRMLEVLYDREGGYVALDELARSCRLDRSGVESRLDDLRRQGHRLEFLPGGGVCMPRPARPAPVLIERRLGVRRVGRSVLCFDEVGSTNDVALDAMRQPDGDGLVVLAESQRSGRGRQGRRWVCPPGSGILMSVLLLEGPGPDRPRRGAMTIAAGLAVAEAVEISVGLACELKWPNDVLLEGAKVAGVLAETRTAGGGASATVIGIGVNVNAAPPAEAVDRPATHLADHLGGPAERVEVVRALLCRLDEWVGRVEAGRLEELHRGFLARCRMINERVTIRCGGSLHTGRVLDVDPLGGLVLCHDDGSRAYLPAEASSVM